MTAFNRLPAPVRCAALLVLCLPLCARAGEATSSVDFALDAQPLAQALAAFDARTGLSVFFPSELVQGRHSAAVHGTFPPDAALQHLLNGSGLRARAVAPGAYVLSPLPAAPQAMPSQARPDDGLVQRSVLSALCAAGDLAPGTYRLALSLRFDAAGKASQVKLLDTTGNEGRDQAITHVLKDVSLPRAPADTSRPFVVLVRQRPAAALSACPESRQGRAPVFTPRPASLAWRDAR